MNEPSCKDWVVLDKRWAKRALIYVRRNCFAAYEKPRLNCDLDFA
jgi:hypothetical protein